MAGEISWDDPSYLHHAGDSLVQVADAVEGKDESKEKEHKEKKMEFQVTSKMVKVREADQVGKNLTWKYSPRAFACRRITATPCAAPCDCVCVCRSSKRVVLIDG